MFNVFIGKTIIGFYSVRLIEKEDYFDLEDTLIVKLHENKILQILIEDPYKKISHLIDESNIEIGGEYDPIEIKLIPLNTSWLKTPFLVNEVTTYYTTDPRITGRWQGVDNQIGNDYILGAILKNNKAEFFIRTAYEELSLETISDAVSFFKKCDLEYRNITKCCS